MHLHSQNFWSCKRVYWSEDKQTRNLVSFDPANFEMSEIYHGNFQSLRSLAQLFFDNSAVTLREKREIVGEALFPALKMQFGQFY